MCNTRTNTCMAVHIHTHHRNHQKNLLPNGIILSPGDLMCGQVGIMQHPPGSSVTPPGQANTTNPAGEHLIEAQGSC